MDDLNPVTLLEESTLEQARADSDVRVVSFSHDLLGQQETFHFGVRDQAMALAEVVPVVRSVCERVMSRVTQELDKRELGMPCAAGCAVCCRFLIFLSIPEAFRLVQDVMALPEHQRGRIIKKTTDLFRRFQHQLSQPVPPDKHNESQEARLFRCYKESVPDCPFLEEEVCALYDCRPMVCRERIVSGPIQCPPTGKQPPAVLVPISMAETFAHLTMALENSQHEVVVLPSVFEWVQANQERGKRMWPAHQVVTSLIQVMQILWKA